MWVRVQALPPKSQTAREKMISFILSCNLMTFSIYLCILSQFVTSSPLFYRGLVDCALPPACCCHKTSVWSRFMAVQPQWRGDPGSHCCYKAPCPILELSLHICMLWMLVDALLSYTRSVWLHWYVIKCRSILFYYVLYQTFWIIRISLRMIWKFLIGVFFVTQYSVPHFVGVIKHTFVSSPCPLRPTLSR